MQAFNAPQLGTPVPGTTGGMPATAGLPVGKNPMAQQLQSLGRGEDSMLVHMTPDEVNSLQGLAMATGGSLTINPHTGLPEAGWLGKLLPMIAGLGLNFLLPGVGSAVGSALGGIGAAAGTGVLVGAGTAAITGDLKEGLMAGLGAYGGASLAGGIKGLGTAAADTAKTAGQTASAVGKEAGTAVAKTAGVPAVAASPVAPGASFTQAFAPKVAAKEVGTAVAKTAGGGLGGFMQGFGDAAKEGMTGLAGKAAVPLAGMGVMNTLSEATAPQLPTYNPKEEKSNYAGPYVPGPREVSFQTPEQMRQTGGAEYKYFTPSNPVPGYRPATSLTDEERKEYGFADGGLAALPASAGFSDAVNYFNSANPGAITASMYPTSTPAAVTPPVEKAHAFNNRPATQSPSMPNTINIPGIGSFDAMRDNLGWLSALAYGAPQAQPQYTPAPAPSNPPAPQGMPVFNPGYESDYSSLFAPAPAASVPAPVAPAPVSPPAYDYGLYGAGGGSRDFGANEYVEMYAKGGPVNMRDGSFVVDARTVSELGNGSSNAGIEALARMGGHPVRGPGDGVSDSVPAKIGGKQEARVARDEVIFSPEAVQRLGGGSQQRGTQKLYALMDRAHKARKKAQRGQDTNLRKGLA